MVAVLSRTPLARSQLAREGPMRGRWANSYQPFDPLETDLTFSDPQCNNTERTLVRWLDPVQILAEALVCEAAAVDRSG